MYYERLFNRIIRHEEFILLSNEGQMRNELCKRPPFELLISKT